jgi:preprotein translocase subunit SecD
MKRSNAEMVALLVGVGCCLVAACSRSASEKPAAHTEPQLVVAAESRAMLDDGVYPIVLADKAMPESDRGLPTVELINIPIEGSEHSTPEKIRVLSRPLLRFRNLSHFDFTFEKNECTQIGFQNSDDLKAYTRDHVGYRLAVVVGNRVISHHKIREPIEADKIQITCCSVGGGDHLHKHLKEIKLASDANRQSKTDH